MKNRTLLKYHSYLGLISGLFLIIIGLSGAVLAFNEDIDDIIFKKYIAEDSPSASLQLDKAIKTVQTAFPQWEIRIVKFKPGESIIFNLRLPDARRFVFVHPETGKVIANINANTTLTKWLLKLHYSFHAGLIGRILVLIMGILFFLSLITGLILYRKIIIKTLLFQVKIKKGPKHNLYSVLHRYIGVWALLLNIVLVITGIFLAYKVSKSGFETPKLPTPNTIAHSVENVLLHIKEMYPDFSPTYIRLPKTETSPITVNGTFEGDPFYLSEYFNKFLIDNRNGNIISVTKIAEASVLTRLDSMISPLHFGQFGGLWIKVLYCIVGLTGPFLSVSGFIIWRRKRVRD